MNASRPFALADLPAVAAGLAAPLAPGAVLALDGGLGAGKTTLVRALVAALGGDARQVSSPTFVLLHVYDTPRGRVYHLDAYRADARAVEDAGWDDWLADGIVVVEWAERVETLLPAGAVRVRLEVVDEGTRRLVPSPGTPGEG